MNDLKCFLIIPILFIILSLVGCKSKEYIEVPVTVEKVNKEYIYNKDSVFTKDSVWVLIDKSKDTVIIDRYNLLIREKYLTDTIHKIDSIPVITTVTKTVEVNRLKNWLKLLMALGGVFIFCITILITYYIAKWKLRH